MLPQGEGLILPDSSQGDGDGISLSLKGSLTEQRWQQQGLWNSTVTIPSFSLWSPPLVENCSAWYVVTCDLVTKNLNFQQKIQERDQKHTHAPNNMISGGKKDRVVRCSQIQHATQILQLLFSHSITYMFLNLTLQHMEKVLALLWKNSAARNRALIRFGLLSWH